MGGRGTAAIRNSETPVASTTKENAFGFEVENTDYPEIEFKEQFWKEMFELAAKGKFRDTDLRDAVDNKISDLVNEYEDLERYDPDLTNLRERIENNGVTDDEYWAAYHEMARMLNIEKPRAVKSSLDKTLRRYKRQSKNSASSRMHSKRR